MLGTSPLAVIVGPVSGGPLIIWLAAVAVAVALQRAVGLALRQSVPRIRIFGALAALGIAILCGLYVLGAGLDLMFWLTHGMPIVSGPTFDLYDFVAAELFILPALVIGWLNGRAAILAARGLRRPSATPRPLGG